MKYRYRIVIFFLIMCLLPVQPALAAPGEEQAQDLTNSTAISGTAYNAYAFLKDGNVDKYITSYENASIRLENAEGMAALYLYFDLDPGTYTILDEGTGTQMTAGQYGFLHEYVDLQEAFGYLPTAVTLQFGEESVRMSELYVFSSGQTPDFVQKWQKPWEGGADIVLFSTHSDDDQLFFAGLVPLYAGEMGCRVQVVMMTDHRKGPYGTNGRTHEVLNGLWATGLTAYPVFGDFVDNRIDDKAGMYQYYANMGISKQELQAFVVEQLRRFKPLVAIGHDLDGEYGHGMHKIYAELLANGVEIAADESQYAESAQSYGVWDTPKTYLHLYGENQIVLDYDQPLERFDGLSAFQASQKLGYPCHKSQAWTWFTGWINGNGNEITKVTQIKTYNPAYFGLYRSTVGPDVNKNDFLENIHTYDQQDAMAAQVVVDQIQALGTITLESQAAILAARKHLEELTPAQQALVTNVQLLQDAEQTLQTLQKQLAADRGAADKVIAKIDALGEITLESESAILDVWDAYGALTDVQKTMVSNLEKLNQAQSRLQQLQHAYAQSHVQKRQEDMKQIQIAVVILGVLIALLVVVLFIYRRSYRPKYGKKRK